MREAFASAKTCDEAIDLACEELGLPRESVEIEVLEYGKKGFFSKTLYKVRAYVEEPEKEIKPEIKKEAKKETKKEAPKKESAPVVEETVNEDEEIAPSKEIEARISTAVSYVESIVKELGLTGISVSYKYTKGGLKISVDGDDVGVVIGKRGEALDALQTLTSLAVNKREDEYLKVSVGSGDYREKRKKTLEELAIKVAKNVAESGRKHTFEPMSAYERRIIHSAAATVEGVSSKSFGEEPERKVVILSNNPRPSRDNRRRDGRGRRDNKPREERPVGGTNHSDDSAYFSLLDELQ